TARPEPVKPPPPIMTEPLKVLFERNRVAGKVFTMTAYVRSPAPNTVVTLTLPPGLQLVTGTRQVKGPPAAAGAPTPHSPATWRTRPLRRGPCKMKVSLNNKVAPGEGPVVVGGPAVKK